MGAHSVGTWVAFEPLMFMRKIGLPMPKACLFNAFCPPDIPEASRPWLKSAALDSIEFIEEFKKWDAEHLNGRGSIIFKEPSWSDLWQPIMRNDFRLFDEYIFSHTGVPKFNFPIHSFHMEGDYNIKENMVRGWQEWTTSFEFEILKGMGHLTCIYVNAYKNVYFE